MKLQKFQFLLIFITYLISESNCTQADGYSEGNELNVVTKNTLTSIVPLLKEKSNALKLPKRKRVLKKRKRKRKKVQPIVNTSTQRVSFTNLILPTTVYANNTLSTKKGVKKRKKNKRKLVYKKRKLIGYRTKIKSDSLVLPIVPRKSNTSKLELTTARTIRKLKKTRCGKENGGCAHICHSTGPEKCSCLIGFSLASDHHKCVDINECLTDNGGCQTNCTNTIGSYRCACPHGLRLSFDSKTCEDINECLLRNGHGPCQDTCENTYGGYKCKCNLRGTKLANDLHNCIDINECVEDNGGCSHVCINTFGRSFCSCPNGMELSEDFKTCIDINECEHEITKSHCLSGCVNTIGSYRCLEIIELQNDQSYQELACKPLFPPQNGYFKCNRKHALKTFTKSGRKVVKNSLGTRCILVCPEGFKQNGTFRVACGYGGEWIGQKKGTCVPL